MEGPPEDPRPYLVQPKPSLLLHAAHNFLLLRDDCVDDVYPLRARL